MSASALELISNAQLEIQQFQEDKDTPGLYLQCASVNQREAVMRLLGWSPAKEYQLRLSRESSDAVQTVLIKAWHIAKDGCLLPPDGGSPTEGEIAVSTHIANRIREMMPDSRLPILGGDET